MGHCKGSGPHMESAKQEKYNLMHDNPVAKHASGGSWMSKHSKSAMHMGHSPAEMGHDSPAKKYGAMKGDQSKTRLDYKNYKGTDKGYHGHSGSSHEDQSASKADYTSAATMSPYKMGHSPLNENETPAERKARLKKENKAELARLNAVKAKREARNAADAKKPKPKKQTRLQALKARVVSDLTGKTGKGGPGSSRN